MKKKLSGLLVLSALFLAGCGQNSQNFKVNLDSIEKSNVIDNKEIQKKKTQEINREVKPELEVDQPVASEPTEPMGKSKKTPREIAKLVTSFGVKSEEYMVCLNEAVTNCQQMAVQSEIQKTKSANPCNYLGSEPEKISCLNQAWQQIAIESGSVDVCNKVRDDSMKESCVISVLSQLARSSSDISFCNKINEDVSKRQCRNSFFSQMALDKSDEKICDKIESDLDGDIDMCKDMVRMEKEMKDEQIRMEKEMQAEEAKREAQMKEAQIRMNGNREKDVRIKEQTRNVVPDKQSGLIK